MQFTFKFQFCSMKLGNSGGERKSDSSSVLLTGAGFIHHVKCLCDAGNFLFGDSAPIIRNHNLIASIHASAQNTNGIGTGFDGVVGQIQ